MISLFKFIWHYREILELLQDFAKAESTRLANGTSDNAGLVTKGGGDPQA